MAILDYIIPGYKGYRQREESRNTDRALREYMSTKLGELHSRMEQVKVMISRDLTKMQLLNDAEQATMLLRKVRDRLNWSNMGFAPGLFTSKIDALRKVEEYDQQLETLRQKAFDAMDAIESAMASGDPKMAFINFSSVLREIDQALNDREHILSSGEGKE